MSNVISVEADIDLDDYTHEIKHILNGTLKSKLKEYVKEMKKNLYVYTTKKEYTAEGIYNDLLMMLKEND